MEFKVLIRRTAYFLIALGLATFLLIIGSVWLGSPALTPGENHVFYVAPEGSDTNEGSITHPWATVNHAADVLKAGETVYIRGGTYQLTEQVQAKHSGAENQWITYRAFPDESVILDASAIRVGPPAGQPPFDQDQGTFQLENVAYLQVKNLKIINSHNSGITVRNSHHISLYNNTTENTFSPGIGVWHSNHQKVLGNTVINANAHEMAGFTEHFSQTPHEAISLGSVENFEVAYNLVHDGQKEGIDIKETSKHGTVHHNYVHHMARQAFYIDSWFGVLTDVEMSHNVAQNCQGAGFALSVEDGSEANNIRFHHNLLYDNWGTGILFSRWGDDGLRQNVKIYNNTVYHNGYGEPNPGDNFYWITGGLYLFSNHLQDIEIENNILSENAGFQMGYSDRYVTNSSNIQETFHQQKIDIHRNLIFGINNPDHPIYAGWEPDNYANIYATNGTAAVVANPQFVDPGSGNFYLRQPPVMPDTLQTPIGAFPSTESPNLWWHTNFPPDFPL